MNIFNNHLLKLYKNKIFLIFALYFIKYAFLYKELTFSIVFFLTILFYIIPIQLDNANLEASNSIGFIFSGFINLFHRDMVAGCLTDFDINSITNFSAFNRFAKGRFNANQTF